MIQVKMGLITSSFEEERLRQSTANLLPRDYDACGGTSGTSAGLDRKFSDGPLHHSPAARGERTPLSPSARFMILPARAQLKPGELRDQERHEAG